MLKYTLKKLLMMIPMLLIISALIFCGIKLTGADPVNYLVTPDMAANPALLEALREKYGLNDPIHIQYFRWLGQLLHGNFGTSIVSGSSISSIIQNLLPATLLLSSVSLLLAAILGITIGIVSAIKQNGIIDYVGRFLAVLGQAMPQFLIGLVLLMIFSIKLGWLPATGRYSADASNHFVDGLRHMILPCFAITISMCSIVMRYARNSMLFSGSVVIESVFSWPGIGSKMTSAVVSGDYTVIMILALTIAASVLVASFLLDLISAWLDPRVRLGL